MSPRAESEACAMYWMFDDRTAAAGDRTTPGRMRVLTAAARQW